MLDEFAAQIISLTSPATKLRAITPSDGADLSLATRSLYVGTAGDVRVIAVGDTDAVTIPNVQPGYHPLRLKKVLASGTTATGLVGLS